MVLPATDSFTTATTQLIDVYSANWARWNTVNVVIPTSEGSGARGGSEYCAARWIADTFDANHYSQVVYSSRNNLAFYIYSGPAVRATAGGNHYHTVNAFVDVCYAGVLVNGAETVIASIAAQPNNTLIRMEANGSSITTKINGTTNLSLSFTDSTHIGGAAGIAFYDAGQVDDWEGGNLGGNSTNSTFIGGNCLLGVGI